MRILTTVAVLALSASPLLACMNDEETVRHEREFRSSYQAEPTTPRYEPKANSYSLYGYATLGALAFAGSLTYLVRSARA